jgi:hypothetical protein
MMRHVLEGLSWLGFVFLVVVVSGAIVANALKFFEYLYLLRRPHDRDDDR